MTHGVDPRTYDMAQRILQEEIEHEAWFVELLSMERDGEINPAGHFVRGEPGDAPLDEPSVQRQRITAPVDRLIERLRCESRSRPTRPLSPSICVSPSITEPSAGRPTDG